MSESKSFLFTSESVTEGHPDKVADAISDSILDAIMAEDKKCRVACETLVTTGLALVAGEITEGHARALLGLPEGRGRVNAWREVVKRKLSVRDTEGYVRRQLAEAPATTSSAGAQTARRDSAYGDIESRLRRALSTRVKVEPQKKGAKIVIECYSDEEFENVVSSLLGEYQ